MSRWSAAALLAVLALACAAVPAAAAPPGNPMAQAAWWVDPTWGGARAARDLALAGQPADPAFSLIGAQPYARWFIASDPASHLAAELDAAQRQGRMAVFAIHALPHPMCTGDDTPGNADAASYESWVSSYAAVIGSRPAVVIVEPDELPATSCLPAAWATERIALEAFAVRTFSALPNTGVYLDIGAGDWLPLAQAAALLKAADVADARGFALNATHFDWTSSEIAYGEKLSALVGGKHFLVNTAMNGRGPQVTSTGFHLWCNPQGRSLGPLPTLQTPSPLVDAFFWLIEPGLSSGTCNGGPPVGTFWDAWAQQLFASTAGAPDFPVYRGGGPPVAQPVAKKATTKRRRSVRHRRRHARRRHRRHRRSRRR